MTVPTGPLTGVKLVIAGGPGGVTVKFVEFATVPTAVLIFTGPIIAPAGTLNVSDVASDAG